MVTVFDGADVTVDDVVPSSVVEATLLVLDDTEAAVPLSLVSLLSGVFVGVDPLELEVGDTTWSVLVALWSAVASVGSTELRLDECFDKLMLRTSWMLKVFPELVPDVGELVGDGLAVEASEDKVEDGEPSRL